MNNSIELPFVDRVKFHGQPAALRAWVPSPCKTVLKASRGGGRLAEVFWVCVLATCEISWANPSFFCVTKGAVCAIAPLSCREASTEKLLCYARGAGRRAKMPPLKGGAASLAHWPTPGGCCFGVAGSAGKRCAVENMPVAVWRTGFVAPVSGAR